MTVDVLRAIVRGNREQLDKLIEQGHDLLEVTVSEKWNYLHKAFLSPRRKAPVDMIHYLIDFGVDAHAVDCYGNTPLHYAIRQKNPAGAKALLQKNGHQSINHMNVDGVSPLRQAFSEMPFDHESIKVLLEFGADLDQKNNGGSVRELVHILAGVDNETIDLIAKY